MLCIFVVHKVLHLEEVMQRASHESSAKKRTNLSLNSALLEEAKTLGINLSKSAESGIAEAVRKHKKNMWLKENKHAIESSNKFVEEHGLPLDKHRKF